MTEKIEARDIRESKFLWIDHSALEVVSQECGANGIAVYSWLCSHAEKKTQKCFPSITLLAEKCRMKRNTVIGIIRKLEEIEAIRATRQPGGVTLYEILSIKVTSIPTDTSTHRDTGISRGTGAVSLEAQVPVPVGAHEQQSSNNNHLTIIKHKEKNKASPVLEEALNRVDIHKFNVYQLLEKYKQIKKAKKLIIDVPECVILTVVQAYLAQKDRIRSIWPWFMSVLEREMGKHCSEQNIAEHDRFKQEPSALGNILAEIASHAKASA